jgi:hypothetical protein
MGRQPTVEIQTPHSFAGPAIARLIITTPWWLVNVKHLTRLEILPSSQCGCTYPISGGKDKAKVAGPSVTALKGFDGVPSIISLR